MKRITSLLIALLLMCTIPFTSFADESDLNNSKTEIKKLLYISQVNKAIEVANILQYPELPTGCESVALTILLNHLGYPADKLEIARKYLPKLDFYWENDQLYGADIKTTFAGDPESKNAYGCFAPCIITAAESFFTDKGYDGEAVDLTGTPFEELLSKYIDNDIPVLIWITGWGLAEPVYTDSWRTPEGGTVLWPGNEHCVVLTGYDDDAGIVRVSDPMEGNVTYDYETLKKRYIELGQQAVRIKTSRDTDTDTKRPEPDSIIGDTNGDGKITAKDSISIQRYVINLLQLDDYQLALSDVNTDGKVTNKDSLSILRYTISLSDNNQTGKELKSTILGEWTNSVKDDYTNLSFSENGTVSIQSAKTPWSTIASWSMVRNEITVSLFGQKHIYIYSNGSLVKSTDNTSIFVRDTSSPEKETDDPNRDNGKETADQGIKETPDESDKETQDQGIRDDDPPEKSTRKQIDVENMLQNPDLPTGSESVSLTMLLNHLGYPADKFEIVRKYLPKQAFYYVDGELYGADFRTTFAGDPEDPDSYGCYAPCIVTTANNYFADKNLNGKAYDLSSTDFETLLSDYIDNDIPLIIWITNYDLEPSSLSTVWKTPDGQTVQWRRPEHCVVLTGYDREKGIVYTSDPLYGNKGYDYDTLVARFNEMGKQAVLIRNRQNS